MTGAWVLIFCVFLLICACALLVYLLKWIGSLGWLGWGAILVISLFLAGGSRSTFLIGLIVLLLIIYVVAFLGYFGGRPRGSTYKQAPQAPPTHLDRPSPDRPQLALPQPSSSPELPDTPSMVTPVTTPVPPARMTAHALDTLILPASTKEALMTYCEILSNHQRYYNLGMPIPKGLLFYGPPGCGKTETARLLSTKSGLPFISLSSADLKVGYIGHAAVAIQKAFDEARQKAPCIIYIDEIDASCPIRGGASSVIDREVNAQLLQELDGIKTTDARPVFVLASTNRLELIDPAILERFTERIEIPLPGENERWLLLEIFIGKIPLEVPALPDGDNEIEAQLKALGYQIEMVGIDLATIRLGSSGKRTFLKRIQPKEHTG